MNNISTRLNKISPGVKNWKVLAYKLGVSNEVYDAFDENGPKKSPTKMMLEWLKSERPEMTVDQLRKALEDIDRADARDILDKYHLSQQGNLTNFIKASPKIKMMIMTMRDEDNNGYNNSNSNNNNNNNNNK